MCTFHLYPGTGHSRPWEEAQLPPPYWCVYQPGARFSLAHKNPGVHGAVLLSFSGAACRLPPPFEPHQNFVFVAV